MTSFDIGASRPVGAVQPNSPVLPASQAPTPADSTPTPAATSAAASVETSLNTSAGTVPVDQNRVEQIRKAVQDGTYPVLPTKISDAMIAAGVMLQKGNQ